MDLMRLYLEHLRTMSRSYKKSYTKSKAFDKTCRCHGRCPYCRDNRMYNTLRKIEATKAKKNEDL